MNSAAGHANTVSPIATPSLALHLVHVCSVTSPGLHVPGTLEMNIHTLDMPARAGMGRGLCWLPLNVRDSMVFPLPDVQGGTTRSN